MARRRETKVKAENRRRAKNIEEEENMVRIRDKDVTRDVSQTKGGFPADGLEKNQGYRMYHKSISTYLIHKYLEGIDQSDEKQFGDCIEFIVPMKDLMRLTSHSIESLRNLKWTRAQMSYCFGNKRKVDSKDGKGFYSCLNFERGGLKGKFTEDEQAKYEANKYPVTSEEIKKKGSKYQGTYSIGVWMVPKPNVKRKNMENIAKKTITQIDKGERKRLSQSTIKPLFSFQKVLKEAK